MDDPMLKKPLEQDEVAQLASGADYQFYARRTPGLSRMSGGEAIAVIVFLFIIGTSLYIHLDVRPFLPFAFSPTVERWLTPFTFLMMALGILGMLTLLGGVVLGLAAAAKDRIAPPTVKVVCHNCGTRSPWQRYQERQGCRKCGSRQVYCGKCGQPSDVEYFLSGDGCTHCGHGQVALRQ